MTRNLTEILRAAKSAAARPGNDDWNYSVRAREYAKWLDQIYKELQIVRERNRSKTNQ